MSEEQKASAELLSDDQRARLQGVRGHVLRLHKILLDRERADYERTHGRVSSGQMLQLLIGDARFAWLRPLSALVVEVDEFLEQPGATAAEARDLLARTRDLFTADSFWALEGRYFDALLDEPDALLRHGEVMRLLA
jgi:hypothetical protein